MGTILELTADRLGRDRRNDAETPAGSCEIIIFPGVRIERSELPPGDQLPPSKATGPRRRKRARKTA